MLCYSVYAIACFYAYFNLGLLANGIIPDTAQLMISIYVAKPKEHMTIEIKKPGY